MGSGTGSNGDANSAYRHASHAAAAVAEMLEASSGGADAPAIVRTAIDAWEVDRRAEQPDAEPVMQVVMAATAGPESVLLVGWQSSICWFLSSPPYSSLPFISCVILSVQLVLTSSVMARGGGLQSELTFLACWSGIRRSEPGGNFYALGMMCGSFILLPPSLISLLSMPQVQLDVPRLLDLASSIQLAEDLANDLLTM